MADNMTDILNASGLFVVSEDAVEVTETVNVADFPAEFYDYFEVMAA